MQTDISLTYHKNVLLVPIVTICVIWFIYWVEIRFGYNFNKYGIFPRSFRGY
jgi:cbb3-type cytochrome oxidase subunit 3